jgi:flavin-dependent dehydrogenase
VIDDVIVAGGGPAGALAALLLARAGARVRLFDRARFPRPKLCGDTLNPGALAVLARHVALAPLLARSHGIHGMRLSGPDGVTVSGRYPDGIEGRAVTRDVLDAWLLGEAGRAGVQVEDGQAVAGPLVGDARVRGVRVRTAAGHAAHPARLVVAADGRRSPLALALGLLRQPARPRRWAIGAYLEGVTGMDPWLGEMHVRRGHYLGLSPVPGGLTNACLVVSQAGARAAGAAPLDALMAALRADVLLAARMTHARPVSGVAVLGPLAADASTAGAPGMLLAGDAAGFIDPMTGDGLRLALAGAELAADAGRAVLDGRLSPDRAAGALAEARRCAFGGKQRVNRALRALVDWPAALGAAAAGARVVPACFEALVRYAADTAHARPAHG